MRTTPGGGGRARALRALPLLSRLSSRSNRPVPGGVAGVNPDPGLSLQADTRKGRSACLGSATAPRSRPRESDLAPPRGGGSLEVGSGARARGSDVTARPQSRSASRVGLRYAARPGLGSGIAVSRGGRASPAARCGWEWLSRCGAARASLVWRCWAPHHVWSEAESGRAPAPCPASGRRVVGAEPVAAGAAGEHAGGWRTRSGVSPHPLATPRPRLMPFGNGAARDPAPPPPPPLPRQGPRGPLRAF